MSATAGTPATGVAAPEPALSEYELRHLAAHLEAADRHADLHRLLGLEAPTGGNLWFQAKERVGDEEGYATDLERGWRLARDAAARSLEVRYALMASSLASRAGGVPPGLVTRLIDAGAWTVEQAVAAARRMPDLERRATTLVDVAARSQLQPEARDRVFGEALQAAGQIPDAYRRSRTVAALALQLPASLLARVYLLPLASPEELEAAYSTGMESGTVGSSVEEPSAGPADVDRLLAEAASVEDEPARVALLAAATPHLTTANVVRAVQLATALTGEFQRTVALARVVPRLVELGLVDDARAALTSLASSRGLDEGVARLVAADPDARRPIADPFWAAEVMARAVPVGDPNEAARLGEALRAARRVGDDEQCDAVIGAAVELLAGAGALDRALAAAAHLRSSRRRAEAVTAAASGHGRVDPLLALAREVADPYWRGVALLAVLPLLAGPARDAVLGEVAGAAEAAVEPGAVADLLVRLGCHRRDPDRDEAWRRAVALAAGGGSAVLAAILVAGLRCDPARWRPLAAEHVGAVSEGPVRDWVLLAFADPALISDPYWRNLALAEAAHDAPSMATAAALDLAFVTPALVAGIATALGEAAVAPLAELVEGQPDAGRRAHCLAALAGAAGGSRREVAGAAVEAAALPGDERERGFALARVAAVSDAGRSAEVFAAVAGLRDIRARAVAELGAALATTAPDAVGAAVHVRLAPLTPDDAGPVVLRLASGVPGARPPLLPSMARLVDDVDDEEVRVRLVRAVAAGAESAADTVLGRCWTGALLRSAPAGRPALLRAIEALLPVARRLGGDELVAEVAGSAAEVRRWWP